MEEIYIIYWSQTGNTQTMAEAIGKGVEKAGKTAQVLSVEDAALDVLKQAPCFALGCPSYEFGHLNEYPYRSVCTISTHDMSTLRGWWEEDYQQTQRYYNTMLGHYGTAPAIATPELCEEIVRNHLNSNSILCILSFQDWLSVDGKWRNPNVEEERINVPSNPRNYWRYRMHITLEQLMKAKELNSKISELIQYTGRNPEK